MPILKASHVQETFQLELKYYLRCPFRRELDFDVTRVNYGFAELLSRAGEAS